MEYNDHSIVRRLIDGFDHRQRCIIELQNRSADDQILGTALNLSRVPGIMILNRQNIGIECRFIDAVDRIESNGLK
jgi:hypothetical protein